MSENRDPLESEMNLRFPMITISVSYDDVNEPIHVDLGSVPPFVAASVLEKVLKVIKLCIVGPKVSFNGTVIAEPIPVGDVRIEDLFWDFEEGENGEQG